MLIYLIMKTLSIILVAMLTMSVSFISSTFNFNAKVHGQTVDLDITSSTLTDPFGGEKIGTLSINPSNNTTTINAIINQQPGEGNVYEGWLVDEGGSGYELSLGRVGENGTLNFQQDMVNPYTYSQFIITEEPENDADPGSADAKGGAELQSPFGQ